MTSWRLALAPRTTGVSKHSKGSILIGVAPIVMLLSRYLLHISHVLLKTFLQSFDIAGRKLSNVIRALQYGWHGWPVTVWAQVSRLMIVSSITSAYWGFIPGPFLYRKNSKPPFGQDWCELSGGVPETFGRRNFLFKGRWKDASMDADAMPLPMSTFKGKLNSLFFECCDTLWNTVSSSVVHK